MKKDETIKQLIKHRNNELCTRLFRLSPLWWSLIISLIAILLLYFSFLTYDCYNWLSGALVSTSCGFFTGLVFYFLSNIRNNKLARLQREHMQLEAVLDVLKNIINTTSYYKFKASFGGKRDVLEDRENVFLWLDELESTRNQLSIELYDILTEKGYDPSDRDNLKIYRDRLCSSNHVSIIEEAMTYINKELLPFMDELQELHREREDQLMLMGKHFF